jgi:hypothetical protein
MTSLIKKPTRSPETSVHTYKSARCYIWERVIFNRDSLLQEMSHLGLRIADSLIYENLNVVGCYAVFSTFRKNRGAFIFGDKQSCLYQPQCHIMCTLLSCNLFIISRSNAEFIRLFTPSMKNSRLPSTSCVHFTIQAQWLL